jgi:endoglucanase
MRNTADNTNMAWRPLRRFAPGAALLLISFAAAHGQSKTLPANTRFFIPEPPSGAVQQVESALWRGWITAS